MPKILIVAAHPDDEVLGCGGTIAKYSKKHDFYCLILGEGAMAREGAPLDEVNRLRDQCKGASEVLGIKHTCIQSLPDNRFDTYPLLSTIKLIEKYLDEIGSVDCVFTHFWGDLNVDHQYTSNAVQTVFRPYASTCKALLLFEIPSSTVSGFWPTLFIDVEETIGTKTDALRYYEDEIRESPHPRSIVKIRHLAGLRGGQVGFESAEGFIVNYIKGEFVL